MFALIVKSLLRALHADLLQSSCLLASDRKTPAYRGFDGGVCFWYRSLAWDSWTLAGSLVCGLNVASPVSNTAGGHQCRYWGSSGLLGIRPRPI